MTKTTIPLNIRHAQPQDANLLLHFIKELAEFEKLEFAVKTDESRLRIALETDEYYALIAEVEEEAAAFVSYTNAYSAWRGKGYLNLDDLFVSKKFRGLGIGKKLMIAIGRLALERQQHLWWQVRPDNAAATKFYDKLGADSRMKMIRIWNPDQIAQYLEIETDELQ